MPPRKRRSRRQPETPPEPEPVVAQEPEPAPAAVQESVSAPVVGDVPRLTRATQERIPETGGIVSRRPGDHWRDRLMCVWRAAGGCPACRRPRVLLSTFAGEAAVCDLHHAIGFLYEGGFCVCSYDVLERMGADAAV